MENWDKQVLFNESWMAPFQRTIPLSYFNCLSIFSTSVLLLPALHMLKCVKEKNEHNFVLPLDLSKSSFNNPPIYVTVDASFPPTINAVPLLSGNIHYIGFTHLQ